MSRTILNPQVRIYKVDCTTMTFNQNHEDKISKILAEFEPVHIFDRDRFVITDEHWINAITGNKAPMND